MRRTIFVFAALLVSISVSVSFAQQETAPIEPSTQLTCDVTDGAIRDADDIPGLFIRERDAEADARADQASRGSVPSCPTSSTCAGGASTCSANPVGCQALGRPSITDTGWTSCILPNGNEGFCITGQTIKIYTRNCGHCPCCSNGPPFCICPNDPSLCGQDVTWGCAF